MRFGLEQAFGALSTLALLVSANPLGRPEEAPHYGLQKRYQPTSGDLQQTALALVKDVIAMEPTASNCKIVIVGGTALALRFPGYRKTPDLDMLMWMSGTKTSNPKSLKEKLKAKFPGKYDQRPDGCYYKLSPGKEINIDLLDGNLQEFQFSSSKTLSSIHSTNDLPIASDAEIVVTKLDACCTRSRPEKGIQDAKDAQHVIQNGHPNLTPTQKAMVAPTLKGAAERTGTQISWWQTKLGIQASRSPSPPKRPSTPPQRRDFETSTRELDVKSVAKNDYESTARLLALRSILKERYPSRSIMDWTMEFGS